MDAKTERRESAIVKTGNFAIGNFSSNFIPPHTPAEMIAPIWNTMPEYLAKLLYSGFLSAVMKTIKMPGELAVPYQLLR